MKTFVTITLWCIIVLLITACIVLILVDYDTFCNFILSVTGAVEREKQLKEVFLPIGRFVIYKYCISGVLALLIFSSAYLLRHVKSICKHLSSIASVAKHEVNGWRNFFISLSVTERVVLSGIIITGWFSSVYFLNIIPVTIDEALTYLFCTRYSLFASCSYYAIPNNHIFFSILTNFTSILPFDSLVNLRLPNVFIVVFTNILFFRYSLKFFNRGVAFICLTLFAFSFMNFFYSFQARGYEIVLLVSLIVFYCITVITENKNTSGKFFVYYSLASIIGFYTMPSFLYPFIAATFFGYYFLLSRKQFPSAKKLVLSNLTTVLCVAILYAPVIIISGIKSVIANPYSKPIPRLDVLHGIIPHFKETARWIFGVTSESTALLLMIIAIVTLLITSFKTQNTTKIKLLASILLAAPIIVLLHSVIPYPRTWIFLSVSVFISLGVCINYFFHKSLSMPRIYIPVVILCIFVLLSSFKPTYQNLYTYESQEYCIKDIDLNVNLEDINSIGYEDSNSATILKYKILSRYRKKKDIAMFPSNNPECYNADCILLTYGCPNFFSLISGRYKIISSTSSKCGMLLLKKTM